MPQCLLTTAQLPFLLFVTASAFAGTLTALGIALLVVNRKNRES